MLADQKIRLIVACVLWRLTITEAAHQGHQKGLREEYLMQRHKAQEITDLSVKLFLPFVYGDGLQDL